MKNHYGLNCRCYFRHKRCGCEIVSQAIGEQLNFSLFGRNCRVAHTDETIKKWCIKVMKHEKKTGFITNQQGYQIYDCQRGRYAKL